MSFFNDPQSVSSFFSSLYSKKSKEWEKEKNAMLLSTFKEAIRKVSAYSDFLVNKNESLIHVRTVKDFDTVPPINKKNYLRKYPWQKLCKKNVAITTPLVMTSTSGSTGEPFYFPRTNSVDLQSSVYHEMFLRSSTLHKNKSTLVIDCFGMGVWIGGLITYQAFKHVSDRGYPLTIITPGINKHEIFQALKNLGSKYDQIIMCGYPPFMKDLVDQAESHGVLWKNFDIKIIFAAESFSETFRDYIVKKVGIKNVYRDTINIYGSADLGTMASETPICILLRRLALTNSRLYSRLFSQSSRLPTLTQFIPQFVSFEEKNGSIYCTGDNALPLVRYEIGDNGAVLSYDDIERICNEEGVDLKKEVKNSSIEDTVSELPFVCIYERSDFSTKLYGAIIYPEYIKRGLQNESFSKSVTGKFTMYTKNDTEEDEYLEVNIELQPGCKETKTLYRTVVKSISDALIKESAEHKNNTTLLSYGKVEPRVIFWPYEHELHFKGGGKQKWFKKM